MSVLDLHDVRVLEPTSVAGEGGERKAPVVPIVLAHGFGTDQSCWQHVVPHLQVDHTVVLFDLMGAGSTDPECFSFERYASLQGYALDVLAILDALGVSRCVYVGHSMSAMIGCIASLLRPSAFEKLILMNGSPR